MEVSAGAAGASPVPQHQFRQRREPDVFLGPVSRRQVFLGETLDADSITADYTAGVLTSTIPVREAARPRSIQVTSNDTKQAVNARPHRITRRRPPSAASAGRHRAAEDL